MSCRGAIATLFALLGAACAAEPSERLPQTGSGGQTQGSGGKVGSGGSSTGSGGSKGSGGSGGSMSMTGSGGGSGPRTTCQAGKPSVKGVLSGPFGAMPLTSPSDGMEYFLQVNEWNSKDDQILAYGGDYFFKVTTQKASVPTNGGPTGYPSAFIGSNSDHMTSGSNLPKQVSALTSVPTSWTWDDHGTLSDASANSYNATYDVWFSTSAQGDPMSPSGGFLMVWYHKPADAQPVGSKRYSAVSIPGVAGTWDVWIGGSKPVISYVSTTDIHTLSFDLNSFIQDAVKNRSGSIQSNWYLTNVFTGFEIWRGGLNLESTTFCVYVN